MQATSTEGGRSRYDNVCIKTGASTDLGLCNDVCFTIGRVMMLSCRTILLFRSGCVGM